MVALLCAATADAGPRIVGPDDPAGDPIRAAAIEVVERMFAADLDGVMARFAPESPAQSEFLRAQIAVKKAGERTRLAFEKHFGRPSAELPVADAGVTEITDVIRRHLIAVNGDAASIAGGERMGPPLRLARTGGVWKVTALAAGSNDAASLARFYDHTASVMDRVRPRIEAGEFKTPEEAEETLRDEQLAGREDVIAAAADDDADELAKAAPKRGESPFKKRSSADLYALLGKDLGSAEMVRLIDALPRVPELAQTETTIVVMSWEEGITLWFGTEPRTLRSIAVYAQGAEGARQYAGELPAGLAFADRRRDVERKLGAPLQSSGGDFIEYAAIYPARGLYIEYRTRSPRDADAVLRFIRLLPRAPAQVPAAADAKPAAARPRLAFRLVATDGNADDPKLEVMADRDDPAGKATMLVSREVLLDETHVDEVKPMWVGERNDREAIGMKMTADGARRLGELTQANIDRRLALVLDGQVLIAPVIRSRISDMVMIEFGETPRESDRDVLPRLHAAVYSLPPEKAPAPAPKRH